VTHLPDGTLNGSVNMVIRFRVRFEKVTIKEEELMIKVGTEEI